MSTQDQQQQYNYYDLQQNQPPPYPQQSQPYSQPNQAYQPTASEPGRGQALAGVILGSIGLIAWLLPFVGYPVSIAGLVLSIIGRRSFSRRTMATVGVVLSIIALVLTVISSFIGIAAR